MDNRQRSYSPSGGAPRSAQATPRRTTTGQKTLLTLPPGQWTDALTGGREFTGHARVADLFQRLPVALLERTAQD
ncbi:hypothetical protein [Streptomyces puniciscabiei]|uniref:hypothetical protein n=1 Tax=Streptomyces puniciscabiei TaxID=164348 RepID=UPI001154C63C|nr:hypothetical protein [Streptomyces puniciscabiei]